MNTMLSLETLPTIAPEIYIIPEMRTEWDLAQRLAKTKSPVLIRGESGSGKTIIARKMHEMSPRWEQPFVEVNSGSLCRELVQNELFGHRRGAFTGANEDRHGLFMSANGGTIFLDEIADLPQQTQASILTVIESGKFRPVGAHTEKECDVRIIAATNRDLETAMKTNTFREDLYFRLTSYELSMVPIRSYPSRIPQTINHIINHDPEIAELGITDIEPSASAFLAQLPWPGNMRQLRNTLHQMAVQCAEGTILTMQCIPKGLLHQAQTNSHTTSVPLLDEGPIQDMVEFLDNHRLTMEEMRELYLRAVLEMTRNNNGSVNKKGAARFAGISRAAIYTAIEEFELI